MTQELFYVNASAPARFSISGKIYNLQAGESRGPFSKQEIDQVSHSSDRQRLHIKSVLVGKEAAPEIKPSVVDSFTGMSIQSQPELDDLYKGTSHTTIDAVTEDPFVANAKEKLNLFPDTEPSKTVAEERADLTSTKGQEIFEPEKEPILSSMTEKTSGSTDGSDIVDDEPKKAVRRRQVKRRDAGEDLAVSEG